MGYITKWFVCLWIVPVKPLEFPFCSANLISLYFSKVISLKLEYIFQLYLHISKLSDINYSRTVETILDQTDSISAKD